jgi:hypothetical protein
LDVPVVSPLELAYPLDIVQGDNNVHMLQSCGIVGFRLRHACNLHTTHHTKKDAVPLDLASGVPNLYSSFATTISSCLASQSLSSRQFMNAYLA